MSQIYSLGRQTLIGWGIDNLTPAGLALQVCAVNSGYQFLESHSVFADLGSTITAAPAAIPDWDYLNGVLVGDNVYFSGVTPGAVLSALIVFFTWPGNSLLLGYINESIDGSLPAVSLTSVSEVNWNPSGIIKL